jgi:hypothetical protein
VVRGQFKDLNLENTQHFQTLPKETLPAKKREQKENRFRDGWAFFLWHRQLFIFLA